MDKLQPTDDKFELEGDLEADEPQDQEVEGQAEDEESEEGSESAPDSGETREKQVKFDADQQKVFDDTIAKKVYKQREAERESERLRRELEEVKARLPQQSRPMVHEAPDPFAYTDQEYKQRMAYREQSLVQAAQWDAQQNVLRHQEQVRQQEAARNEQAALIENVKTYAERAARLGVKPEELQVAGNIVAQFGIDDSLVQYILNDDQGPLVTKYLSSNLLELEELRTLPPAYAAVRIATIIKPKLNLLKPKINRTPDPLPKLGGSGKAPKQSGPKGATFE
jgi:hypothetical protein